MTTVKTATRTFCIDFGLEEGLRIATDQNQRSIVNKVEALIRGNCGMAIPYSEDPRKNHGARS
jgi:hypothetical protein